MLGLRGVQIQIDRRQRFLVAQTMRSGHPGSKRPGQRAYKCGRPGFKHNKKLNIFNEMCYERGILHAVRRDYRG
jgi:hypothetical protein